MDMDLAIWFIFFIAAIGFLVSRADRGKAAPRKLAKPPTLPPTPKPNELFTASWSTSTNPVPQPMPESPEPYEPYEDGFLYESSLPVVAELNIRYCDASGNVTERDITAHRIGGGHLLAMCHLRKHRRTFSLSRIQQMVDRETGEVIANPGEYLRSKYDHSEEGRIDAAFTRAWDKVVVLVYVAKADGRMLEPERKIISDFLAARSLDLRVSAEDFDKGIKGMAAFENRTFKQSVNNLKSEPYAERKAIIYAGWDIIRTQKYLAPFEEAAMKEIESKLDFA